MLSGEVTVVWSGYFPCLRDGRFLVGKTPNPATQCVQESISDVLVRHRREFSVHGVDARPRGSQLYSVGDYINVRAAASGLQSQTSIGRCGCEAPENRRTILNITANSPKSPVTSVSQTATQRLADFTIAFSVADFLYQSSFLS